MSTYHVYQQQPPRKTDYEGQNMSGTGKTFYEVNLVHVGTIQAANGAIAINLARDLPAFRFASRRSLTAFPIVELA